MRGKLRNTFFKRTLVIQCLMCLLTTAGIIGCSQEKSRNSEIIFEKGELTPQLDSFVRAVMTEYDIPGLSITIVHGNKKLIGCYGKLDEDSPEQVNANTLFSGQSISKTFTAIAVLKATEEGLVHLDSPITRYLPDFRVNSRHETQAQNRITLKHLLSHTSGLPTDAPAGNIFSKTQKGAKYVTLEKRIASLKEVWLVDSVGRRYHYSNVGFDLAAYIVECQGQQPFSIFLKENVLDPMGMQASTFQLDAVSSLSNRAVGHIYEVEEEIPVAFSAIGAGGLYTSAEDLGYFLANATGAFYDILNENSLHQFVTTPSKTDNGYALGVVTNRTQYCTPFFRHTGNGYGFTATIGWMPQHMMGFAILCNRESAYNGLAQIEQAIAKEFLPDIKNDRFCFKIEDLPSAVKRDDYGYYKSVSGDYSNGSITLQFQFRDSLFGIIAPDDGSFHQIHFQSKNTWFFEDDGTTYQFLLHGMWLTNQNNGLTFKKVSTETQPLDKVDSKWASKTGRYRAYAYGVLPSVENIRWSDGNLYLNSNVLKEHLPGLFFNSYGQVVDFRENGVRIEYADYSRMD